MAEFVLSRNGVPAKCRTCLCCPHASEESLTKLQEGQVTYATCKVMDARCLVNLSLVTSGMLQTRLLSHSLIFDFATHIYETLTVAHFSIGGSLM